MPLDKVIFNWAQAAGFTHVGRLERSALRFLPEVREMCASDRCRSYGRNWTCPPACGSLEEITARAAHFGRGILLQSTGTLEDDFDLDSMLEAERLHKERFLRLLDRLDASGEPVLPMAAGGCTLCERCTYPSAPCRFPRRAAPSMEAYGLWVSRVCEHSGLPYHYGPRTITYTSCILYDPYDKRG